MGQRAIGTVPVPSGLSGVEDRFGETFQLCVFPTKFGYFGLAGCWGRVSGLTIGHASARAARQAAESRFLRADAADPLEPMLLEESDWQPAVRERLERYCLGEVVDFAEIELAKREVTPFQQRVLEAARGIGYAERITYGELAVRAGSPNAARAVGNVMAANRVPIIIPCHRVTASGGKWGGYSAAQGVALKRRLLAMEADAQRT